MPSRYLVTGSSKGLGNALCSSLLADGNLVIGFSRSGNRELAFSPNYTDLHGDVSNNVDTQKLFEFLNDKKIELNGVVHAAGVYGPFGSIEEVDETEWVRSLEINLLGTFNILRPAVSLFKKQGFGNFVALSGGGATSPMPRITSYASAKAAVVRLVESVAIDNIEFNLTINSVAPGLMNTQMLRQAIESGPGKIGEVFYQRMIEQDASGSDSTEVAIALIKILLQLQSNRPTGKLISAVWDDWSNLIKDKDYLSNQEIHTLRRVTD